MTCRTLMEDLALERSNADPFQIAGGLAFVITGIACADVGCFWLA